MKRKLLEQGITQVNVLQTENPWELQFDGLVIPSGPPAYLEGGQFADAFFSFLGRKEASILQKNVELAKEAQQQDIIEPDKPLIVSLSPEKNKKRYIIVVTAEDRSGKQTEENIVKATRSVMKLASETDLAHLVIPFIGAGNYRLDNYIVVKAILQGILTSLTEIQNIREITLVHYKEDAILSAVEAAEELLKKRSPISFLKGAANDLIADKDFLGFTQYIKAFADLIESPYTKPPLTIGIFGSWGMGKSFLLDHVARELKQRQQQFHSQDPSKRQRLHSQSQIPYVHIIHFNAWEYNAVKLIWSGLVRKIMNQLEKELSWGFPGLFFKKFSRNLKRDLEETKGSIIFILAILIGLLVFALFKYKIDLKLIWGTVVALGVTGLFKVLADTLSKPLSQWVVTLLKGSNYGKHMNYMEEIHSDLELLATRLEENNARILVIIDDLDRCEPQKAVEVLQAINLLLNFKSFIILLGIDARIVTRAVEKHYRNLLGPAGASGYEYLDKIVQIPFRIPEPNPEEIKSFISEQLGSPQTRDSTSVFSQDHLITNSSKKSVKTKIDSRFNVDTMSLPKTIKEDVSEPVTPPALIAFREEEHEAFYRYARFIRPNPRHIKRLVNVYRLVRTLAEYKQEDFILHNPMSTIHWLVICSQWSYTAYAMLYYFNEMLERIEETREFLPQKNPLDYLHKKLINEHPLDYLYNKVTLQFSKNDNAKDKQQKLDHDLDLLRMLLNEGRHFTWKQLYILSRYTVNFNPAVESILKAEVSIKLTRDCLWSHDISK